MILLISNWPKYIDNLTEIVEKNFQNPNFGAKDMAKLMGISHSTLYRRLKAISSQSISNFICEIRLKHAREMLQQEEGSIAEIAFRVGFNSAAYFSKCFHDYYGYPPSEARKRYDSLTKSVSISVKNAGIGEPSKSIVILPFENFTEDQSKKYLVEGLHDALIGELGHFKMIRVISKTSSQAYSGSNKTITKIASELNVNFVMEGSLISMQENVRIQLKLYRVHPEEKQIMSQSFDVKMSNILHLYSQIIRDTVNEIRITLSPEQHMQLLEIREINPDCYKAYLRGRYYLSQLNEEGMRKGLEYLHEAVRIDPSEAFVHAGLALGYMEIAHGPLNTGDAYAKAESSALQAIKLNPNGAETQLALAELCIYSSWRFEEGEKYFRQALDLNPYLSLAHYHYSWLLFLLGRDEEAIYEHELAQKYDPFNPMIVAFTGILYAYVGRYEDAIREAFKTFEIQRDFPDGYFCLGETYLSMGKLQDAIKSYRKLAKVDPIWKWTLGFAYAMAKQYDEAIIILHELLDSRINSWNAMGIAAIQGALGNMDEAFKWLAYEPHHAWVPWMTVMPMGIPLREDIRITKFVRLWNLTNC